MDNIWKVAGNINLTIAFFCNSNNPRITKSIPVSETKNKSYFLLLLNPWWNMKAMVNIPFSWNPLWNHLAPHKFHWSSNHKWDGKHLVQHETQIANVESKYLWLINDKLLDKITTVILLTYIDIIILYCRSWRRWCIFQQ